VKALPYIRLTFRTASTPDAASARIAGMITPRRFFLKRPQEPFRGTFSDSHFEVMRVLGMGWHNSFLPVVIGDVVQGELGAEVRVRMRLNALVAAFVTVWFGGLFLMTGGFVYDAMTRSRPIGDSLAGLGVMALFAYGLMSISFWTEVTRARLLLRDGLGVTDSDVVEG